MGVPSVNFSAAGRNWTFRFGFGAICSLEEQFDEPFAKIALRAFPGIAASAIADPRQREAARRAASINMRMTDVRAILIAGLGGGLSEGDANDIVDELGVEGVMGIFERAAEGGVTGGEAEPAQNPPKPRRRAR